jgi:hypothetical protein
MSHPPSLRDVIWLKLERGELPANQPEDMSAGTGVTVTCDGCAGAIGPAEITCELTYPGRTLELHLECAGLWAALRLQVRPDLAP